MIFIGYKNIDFEQYTEDGDLIEILKVEMTLLNEDLELTLIRQHNAQIQQNMFGRVFMTLD